jgi:hypothetical protein
VAGHLGIQRTSTKIIGSFFWNTLPEDVTMYVKSCLLCQKPKSVCSLPTGMLQTIKVERPFQKIGVDLLGPFPTSVNGNKMLIVALVPAFNEFFVRKKGSHALYNNEISCSVTVLYSDINQFISPPVFLFLFLSSVGKI